MLCQRVKNTVKLSLYNSNICKHILLSLQLWNFVAFCSLWFSCLAIKPVLSKAQHILPQLSHVLLKRINKMSLLSAWIYLYKQTGATDLSPQWFTIDHRPRLMWFIDRKRFYNRIWNGTVRFNSRFICKAYTNQPAFVKYCRLRTRLAISKYEVYFSDLMYIGFWCIELIWILSYFSLHPITVQIEGRWNTL